MKRLIVGFVWVLLVAQPVMAARSSLLLGAGAGFMPMSDYTDFLASIQDSDYSEDNLALYLDIAGRIALADHHILRITTERISKDLEFFILGDDSTFASGVAEIDFRTIPIGVAYEYFFSGFEDGTSAYAGIGASIYISSLSYRWLRVDNSNLPLDADGERTGNGFGVEAVLGQRAKVSDGFFINVQARGRWADAFMFSDNPGDIKIEATGIDLTVYGEWRIR